MKASKYIEIMNNIISEHGDLDVAYCQYFEQDGTNIFDCDFSFYLEYTDSEDTIYGDKGEVISPEKLIAINHTF